MLPICGVTPMGKNKLPERLANVRQYSNIFLFNAVAAAFADVGFG